MMQVSLHAGITNVSFGRNVKFVEPVNLYGCKIGDDCFIGPFVDIQKNVIVGIFMGKCVIWIK